MDRSKSLKKGAIAVLIFGLVFFVAWVALFVILGLGVPSKFGFNFFLTHLNQVLISFYITKNLNHLPLSIGVIAICGVAAIILILTIIMSIVKRRGFAIFPMFFFIFAAAAGVEAVANLLRYNAINEQLTGYLYLIESHDLSVIIMTIATLACAGVAFVLAFIAWLLSLIHIGKYPKGYKVKVEEEKKEELPLDAEPLPAFQDEPVPEERHLSEQAELLNTLKELIHELKLNQPSNQTVTGATFGGPLVVQYFNGMNPTQPQPAPQPEPKKEEKKEPEYVEEVAVPEPYVEPVKEEPKPEPEPVKEPEPQPEPEPVKEPEPAPVVVEPVPEPQPEPKPEPAPAPEKKPIIRIPFEERMVKAEKEMKDNYNEIKNEILSYGVKSRVSNSGDTFRLHRKTYIKLTIAGKSLKLYFALNPEDYRETTIPVQDASEKGIYEEIPLVFKVKSGLSMKRCKQLIADVMEKDNLTQGEIGKVNWVKEIAANLREAKKAKKEEE